MLRTELPKVHEMSNRYALEGMSIEHIISLYLIKANRANSTDYRESLAKSIRE